MRKTLTILLALAMAAPVQAALPPHYQRQAEFEAALALAVETFGISNPVDAIELVEPDLFSVRSGNCTLSISIVDKKQDGDVGFAGPRQFEAIAGETVCP